MSMRRWDPFKDLQAIQQEMNRLFGRTYGTEADDLPARGAHRIERRLGNES